MSAKRFIEEKFDANKTQYNITKYHLLKKSEFKCYYCGIDLKVSEAQKEHIIPRSKGGSSRIDSGNIVASCYKCNMKKGTKTLEEFRKKLFGPKSGIFQFEKQ